jgi:hypothetical protein
VSEPIKPRAVERITIEYRGGGSLVFDNLTECKMEMGKLPPRYEDGTISPRRPWLIDYAIRFTFDASKATRTKDGFIARMIRRLTPAPDRVGGG